MSSKVERELCEDEGCPQFGTPHICVNVRQEVLQAIDRHVTDDDDRASLRAAVKEIYNIK